jgi:hypothetical protein
MSSGNRKPFLTATVLNQAFLDACHDNLVCQLEVVVEIDTPAGTIYASDRNKYVGDTFYEALLNAPQIKRTLGEWLTPTLELSTVKLSVSNADGRFNNLLPGGADFDGWIDRSVVVKIGVGEIAATYKTLFRGRITGEGGFGRTTKSLEIVARDDFESMRAKFPTNVLSGTEFPNIEEQYLGAIKPVIYGDWRTELSENGASVPAIIVNGADPAVLAGTANLKLFIADHDLVSLDTANIYLVRSDSVHLLDVSDILAVSAGFRTFEFRQGGGGGVTLLDGVDPYEFKTADRFYVRVRGKALGSYNDNIVEIAKDILTNFGNVSPAAFHSNWLTYRDKASPASSAIVTFKARCWLQEPQPAITYALSLLEQVRLEAFIDRDLKIKLRSLHPEDFDASPSYTLTNFDIIRDSFKPSLDLRNNFNRTQGYFNYLPDKKENFGKTKFLRNDDAITQAGGVLLEKGVVFPNLYDEAVVKLQLDAILRMASASFELINCTLTWRSLLLDLGDFVGVDVKIGGSLFDRVPAMVREISYDADGKVPVVLWSTQMLPFPGYVPGYNGTVGGLTAVITEEP